MSKFPRSKKSTGKLKTMGNHNEFLNRITKSFYYAKLPATDRLSLPVTEFAAELFSEVRNGCSLERLDVEEASRISRNACVSPCSFVLALVYLERLKDCNPEYLYKVAPAELFLVSLMVASKFLNDDGEEDEVFNMEWAESGDLTLAHINRLEKEFLNAINWTIYVYDEEFWNRLSKLEQDIAYKEAQKRGWFSYSELNCLMDTVRLASIIHALVGISSVCLVTYAAGVMTLLGSAFVASYVPGTCLSSGQRSEVINQSVKTHFIPSGTDHCNETYLMSDFPQCNSTYDETNPIESNTNEEWNWWVNSIVDWLPNYQSSNDSKRLLDDFYHLQSSGTNSQSYLKDYHVWEDLIVEINWKDTLKLEYPAESLKYYSDFVSKISSS